MGFKLPATGLPRDVHVGDTVAFEIHATKDGSFEIVSIAPPRTGSARPDDAAAKGAITEPRSAAPAATKR